jgi:hypothetical protein
MFVEVIEQPQETNFIQYQITGELFSLLFGVSSSEGASVNVDDWLLSEVDPEDVLLVAVLLQDRLQHAVEASQCGLAGSEDGKTGHLDGQIKQKNSCKYGLLKTLYLNKLYILLKSNEKKYDQKKNYNK